MAAAFGEAASQQLFVYSEIGPWGIGAEEVVPSAAGAVPVAARYARGGVLAAAGGPQVGHDPYGHPLPATFKRQAFAMYEALKREHELRDRAARNGHAVATATGEHSAFAKAV